MKLLKLLILLLGFALVLYQCQPKTDGLTTEQLYEAFQQPTSEYHPFVRWWWNGDKVEADELVREMHLLKEAGIGGPHRLPYLLRQPRKTFFAMAQPRVD